MSDNVYEQIGEYLDAAHHAISEAIKLAEKAGHLDMGSDLHNARGYLSSARFHNRDALDAPQNPGEVSE